MHLLRRLLLGECRRGPRAAAAARRGPRPARRVSADRPAAAVRRARAAGRGARRARRLARMRGAAGGRGAACRALRLIDPGVLHVTLCFLGSSPVGQIDAIAVGVRGGARGGWRRARAGAGRAAVAAAAPSGGPGGRAARPRRAAGARCRRALAAALAGGGWYEPERRPFLAHVTVARVRRGAPASARPELGDAPEPLEFTARPVTLFRSHTGAGGARYEALATIRLSDSSRREPAAASAGMGRTRVTRQLVTRSTSPARARSRSW